MANDFDALPDSVNASQFWRYVPKAMHPYAQLMRLDRPAGWWLLLLPCWVSLSLGAIFTHQPFYAYWQEYILFLLGAIIMRGAGCTYNDIIDRDLDAQVSRTKNRPIPSGKISVLKAAFFLVFELLIGLAILLAFPWPTVQITLFSMIFVLIYPFAKRFTHWPQFFLGLAFNWGVFSGWYAATGEFHWICIALYIGFIAWTIGYDTIYAHQDESDDSIAGIKSTALLFGEKSKFIILGLYGVTMIGLSVSYIALTGAVLLGDVQSVIMRTTLLIGAMHLLWQILKVELAEPSSCLMIFRANRNFGLILTGGFALSTLL